MENNSPSRFKTQFKYFRNYLLKPMSPIAIFKLKLDTWQSRVHWINYRTWTLWFTLLCKGFSIAFCLFSKRLQKFHFSLNFSQSSCFSQLAEWYWTEVRLEVWDASRSGLRIGTVYIIWLLVAVKFWPELKFEVSNLQYVYRGVARGGGGQSPTGIW